MQAAGELDLVYWPVLAARRFEECARALAGQGAAADAFSFASPLYVLIITPSYAVGCGRLCVYAAQAAAGAAVAVLVHRLALRSEAGRVPAALAAMAWVLYAPAAFYGLTLLPVVPLALVVTLWSMLQLRTDGGGPAMPLSSGLASGVAAGLRPPLLLLAALPLLRAIRRRRFRRAAAVAAGVAIPLAALSALHIWQDGTPYPFPRAAGVNLVLGHSGGVSGLGPPAPEEGLVETMTEDIHQVAARVAASRGYTTPAEADAYWTRRALEWIRRNPGGEARLIAAKLGGFFGWRQFDVYYDTERGRARDAALGPLFLPRWAVVLFLALGIPAFLARGRGRWALLLPMAATLAAAVVFVHCERYWLPALPPALAAAAAGVTSLAGTLHRRRWRRAGVLLALSAALMLPGWLASPSPVPECQYLRGLAVRAWMAGDPSAALTLYERAALAAPDGSVTAVYSRYGALRAARAMGLRDRARQHAALLAEQLRISGIAPPGEGGARSIDSPEGRD
jgi:hypothetical protein